MTDYAEQAGRRKILLTRDEIAALPVHTLHDLLPRLEMESTGAARLGSTWSLGWAGRFRDPNDRGSWATLDLRLGRRILNGMKLILEADNVLNRSVSELHGIPLPGRWISVRLDWRGDR